MYKIIMLLCAVGLCCIPLFAQMGDQIDIKKIPGTGRPAMDGNLSDWPSDYNVGGFTKYENVILANPDDGLTSTLTTRPIYSLPMTVNGSIWAGSARLMTTY